MIIIKDKEKPNKVYIPKHYPSIDMMFKIYFIGQTTQEEFNFDVIDILPQDFYYVFSIDFSKMPDQEYNFVLFGINDDKCEKALSCGLLRIGNVKTQLPKHYENPIINKTEKYMKYYGE